MATPVRELAERYLRGDVSLHDADVWLAEHCEWAYHGLDPRVYPEERLAGLMELAAHEVLSHDEGEDWYREEIGRELAVITGGEEAP